MIEFTHTLIQVPKQDREYLRDQRAKIGPKGSFQLGYVDQSDVKRCQRTAAEGERLRRQIQKQQEVVFTFAFTINQDTSLESQTEDLGQVI